MSKFLKSENLLQTGIPAYKGYWIMFIILNEVDREVPIACLSATNYQHSTEFSVYTAHQRVSHGIGCMAPTVGSKSTTGTTFSTHVLHLLASTLQGII